MKKILFLLLVMLVSNSNAQITLTKHDGTIISDGQVLVFNSLVYAQSELAFYVNNVSSSSTRVKIRCESITNSDGSGMELCFGNVCLSSVSAGNSYPNAPVTIAGNSSSGNFDHFLNANAGDGVNYPMDYVFKFYQLDNSSNEVSNAITMTYRYSPTLAINNFSALENLGVKLKSTLIDSSLEFENSANVNMELFDLNGKLVNNQNFTSGSQSVDISNLSNNVYILNFSNQEGKKSSIKIIKK